MLRCCFLPWFALSLAVTTPVTGQSRRIPPPGIEVAEPERKALRELLDRLESRMATDPDQAVRWKAVDWALRHNEIFKADELLKARQILDDSVSRPGLVVHGYRSDIDDSIQPYGLVLPPSYSPQVKGRWRLDVWLHGRGETITELNFIHQRLTQRGEFAPADTIVLHPFGRYCTAFKFAGETDVFEAIADVQRRYRIDPDRIVLRGFSMGGAGAWHIAAHYPHYWAAAAPGAGFVDTEEYLKGKPSLGNPTAWERQLWTLTNAKEYALNFFNLPVVAYSGEDDPQKAAADIMAREMARFGMPLTHLIGPKTGHRYEPAAKAGVARRIDALAERGRIAVPRRVRFITYTTRHSRAHWIEILGLGRHWDRAEVDGEIRDGAIRLSTTNIERLGVSFGPGDCPAPMGEPLRVTWNGKSFAAAAPGSDRSCQWNSPGADQPLRKRPGLQGPIDDAFLSRFVMVRPSASAPAFLQAQFEYAVREWRAIFRGEPLLKTESQLTDADFAQANVVLWGTPSDSRWMARFPAPQSWPAGANRYLATIFPHPTTGRYIVWNSGFTFREQDSLTNAQQTAKLPDWAFLESPYRVLDAGFYDESWSLPRR